MNMEKLLDEYLDTFGELPTLPKAVGYEAIRDLIQDAVVSKVPVSFDDIVKRLDEIDEPVDLA